MNIYFHELKSYRKSIIIWCISMIVLIAMGMSEQAGLAESGSDTLELLNKMPKSLQALMGGGGFDPTTTIGYYGMIFAYLLLMTTIQAVMIGAGIISKEERDQTFEFLLAKPVTRNKVIGFKLLAALTTTLIFNLVTTIVSMSLIDSKYWGDVVQLMIGMQLVQMLYLSLGAYLAAFRHKKATGLGTGILLITFFLSLFIDMVEGIDFLKYLTPFKYFDARAILLNDEFNFFLVILTLGLTSLFTYLSFKSYDNRDLGH